VCSPQLGHISGRGGVRGEGYSYRLDSERVGEG
jgi:hypothetical protein